MGFSVVVGKDTILLVGGKCNGRNSAFFYFFIFFNGIAGEHSIKGLGLKTDFGWFV